MWEKGVAPLVSLYEIDPRFPFSVRVRSRFGGGYDRVLVTMNRGWEEEEDWRGRGRSWER